jgi:hypothetical protein
MATPTTNEKRLDEAQRIIHQVLKDVRHHISDYQVSDYRALMEVWAKLTTVTLRQDI